MTSFIVFYDPADNDRVVNWTSSTHATVPDGLSQIVLEDPDVEVLANGRINGGALEQLPPSPASRDDVDAERDRRIRAGITFAGTRFQTRDEDMTNIMGAATAALAAITEGAQPGNLRWSDADNDFAWIAEDNSLVPMDAQTMWAFGQAVMGHKQAHIFAAKALKDSDPIPEDFSAEGWWPA